MPCMCGDSQCWSCGPAQGNFRCVICGEWADNGCEHLDDEGNYKPECKEQLEAAMAAERRADDEMARAFREEECGGVFDGFRVTSDADPGL